MKTKINVGILLTGIILGAFLFFGVAQSVHAEDIIPTPDGDSTETATPAPTDPAPVETATPAPTDPLTTETATPASTDSVLTETATPIPTDQVPTETITPMPTDQGSGLEMSPFSLSSSTEISLFAASTPICGPTLGPISFMYNGSKQYCPSLSDAIDQFKIDWLPADGIIYIDSSSTEPQNPVWFYPSIRDGLSTTWLKEIRGTVLDPTTQAPAVTLNSALLISGFTSGIKISNFQISTDTTTNAEGFKAALGISGIDGTVTLSNLVLKNNDMDGIGLLVQTNNGNVVITNVKSDDNAGGGADISTNMSGSIAISNSSFDHNSGNAGVNGLNVETITGNLTVYSPITINGISASGNGLSGRNSYAGLTIKKSGALTIRNSMFNDNYVDGINNSYYLFSIHGNVILDNITASNNYQDNLDPDLVTGGTGINLQVKGNITASNISAENNLVDGINLMVYGNITSSNITANGNLREGTHLDTCQYNSYSLKCDSTVLGNVTITNSQFEGNLADEDGQSQLWVETRGAITLTNVSASQNEDASHATSDFGAFLRNDGQLGLIFPVNVNTGIFSGNQVIGLNIASLGTVNLSKITANGNVTGQGVFIDNSNGISGVNVTGKLKGDNQFLTNGSHGLEVRSKGNIIVNSVVSSSNLGYGAWLDNSTGKGTVAVSYSDFLNNSGYGLGIRSKSAISLTTIGANDNVNFDGITIDNTASGTGYGGDVSLKSVTAKNNGSWGIKITTYGNITGSNLTANENHWEGASFYNQDSIFPKYVTLSNSLFNGNMNELPFELRPALIIKSKGTITLTNVGASENGWDGISLDNETSSGNISINNNANPTLYQIWKNTENGLIVKTRGSISLNGLHVDENGTGAVINNDFFGYTTGVTIQNSYFNNSKNSSGLSVTSRGSISLVITSASHNTGSGAVLNNFEAPFNSPINITNDGTKLGLEFNGFKNNTDTGLEISAHGPVGLTNVEASLNGSDGAKIDNISAVNCDVKVTNSYFDGNKSGGSGLSVTSSGNITLSGGSASGNAKNGITLDNSLAGPSVIKSITILNFKANENAVGYGIKATANGVITLTNVETSENYLYGANLQNNSAKNPDIKIMNSLFNDSVSDSGLNVISNGNVTLTGGSASGNQIWGADINNQGVGKTNIKSITTTNFNFNGNITSYGLNAKATGAITLTNVQGTGNGTYGLLTSNDYQDVTDPLLPWIPGMGVTAKNVTANNNKTGNGLEIKTYGTVLLDLVTASGNSGGDGVKIQSDPLVSGSKSVTINRTAINDLNKNGIEVLCDGFISVNGLSANNNLNFGANLVNRWDSNIAGVTLYATLGSNSFNLNKNGDGLTIDSRGQVSLTTVTANGNINGNGISINNNNNCSGIGCPISNLILNKITTKNNSDNGILIEDTNAAIVTLSGLISLSNNGSGVRLVSQNTQAKISLINSMFMANQVFGIEIVKKSVSMPTLTGTSYFGNTGGNLNIQ